MDLTVTEKDIFDRLWLWLLFCVFIFNLLLSTCLPLFFAFYQEVHTNFIVTFISVWTLGLTFKAIII